MKIDLYLDGNLVEINKDIDFVLNKQFTELTDLTSIIVDYSKTIKVPMTPRNNELFNYVYKLEHQVLINQDIISYDPSQKIPMKMYFNGLFVMEGYAVLNSVNLKDKVYEINLFGVLGKIFSDLKEKPLKDYKSDPNIGFFKKVKMNTRNIARSFGWTAHLADFYSSDWQNYFGWAPQLIGNSDNFNTSGYEEYLTHNVKDFEEVINTTRGITYGDIYVKDGLDLNQYSEMRTYMTRPYVYVDALVNLVQYEINHSDVYDGYTMDIDSDWFQSPYFLDLCYFPGNESIIDNGDSINGLVTWDNSEIFMNFPMTYLPNTTSIELEEFAYEVGTNNLVQIESDGNTDTTAGITLNADGIIVRDRVTGIESNLSDFDENGRWAFYNLDDPYIIPLRYIGIYDSNDQLIYKLYLCDDVIKSVTKKSGFLYWEWACYSIGNVWSRLKTLGSKIVVPNTCAWANDIFVDHYVEVTQAYNFGNVSLNNYSFRFKVGCDMVDFRQNNPVISEANISRNDYHPLCPFKNDKYKNEVWVSGAVWQSYFRPIQSLNVSSNNYRSGSYWSIYDILGNDFNPFTWLIDYCKKFRLFFDINYKTKKIKLTHKYFNDVTYKNVEVDYSKGFVVEPIVNKYKKVNYGYKQNESKKGIKYAKNNGVVYGDVDITTNINLNNETLSLSSDEDEGVFIPIDLSCLTWSNLNSTQPIRYENNIYTNKFITTLDKDNKIEYYPFYAFRVNNAVTWIYLSDDTPSQKNTGEYTYLEHTGLGSGWEAEVEEPDEVSGNVYYLMPVAYAPQFDNYYERTVSLRSVSGQNNQETRGGETKTLSKKSVKNDDMEITFEEDKDSIQDNYNRYEYDDPMTGDVKTVDITYENMTKAANDPKYLYWSCFGVPSEVYNGTLPSNIDNYCIYDRWKNYISEIFNPNNKKVTCYVRLDYPDFINFKFNQLFVIDNSVFLVNRIIDFNPNSTEPTKVELIQISDVNNLK